MACRCSKCGRNDACFDIKWKKAEDILVIVCACGYAWKEMSCDKKKEILEESVKIEG